MKQKLTYLYVFLITIFAFQVVSAQILDKKINLSDHDLTGLKIIAAVKEQAGVRFNYGEAINKRLSGAATVKIKQLTIEGVLELLKTTYGLIYEVNGNYITLSLPPVNPENSFIKTF